MADADTGRHLAHRERFPALVNENGFGGIENILATLLTLSDRTRLAAFRHGTQLSSVVRDGQAQAESGLTAHDSVAFSGYLLYSF
jgi:hypothetical protein